MGRRGPKPKPTALWALQGGKRTSHRPENEDEPVPKLSIPTPPDHLSAEAKREWKRVSKELFTLGMLAAIDRAMLAAYCQTYARWVKAERKLRRTGEIMKTKNGNLIYSPWLAVANGALKQLKGFADEFGLSPSSRTGLRSGSRPKEGTPLEEYRKRLREARARASARRASKPPKKE